MIVKFANASKALIAVLVAACVAACGGNSVGASDSTPSTVADSNSVGAPAAPVSPAATPAQPQPSASSENTKGAITTAAGYPVTSQSTEPSAPPAGPESGIVAPTSYGAIGAHDATLSWLAPDQNTDGFSITDLTGFNIYYGMVAAQLDHEVSIRGVGNLSYVVEGLDSGNWYFEVAAVNAAGMESSLSDSVHATL